MSGALEFGGQRSLLEALELGFSSAELEEKHGLLTAFLRERARGLRYGNQVVELLHDQEGVFVFFPAFPSLAFAWLGEAAGEFLSRGEAQIWLWEALERARLADGDLAVFYAHGFAEDDEKIFMNYAYEGERYQRGVASSRLPLFMWLAAPAENLLLLHDAEAGFLGFRLRRGAPVLGGLRC